MLKNVRFMQIDIDVLKAKFGENVIDNDHVRYTERQNAFYRNIKPLRKGFFEVGLNACHDIATETGEPIRSKYEHRYIRGERGQAAESAWRFADNRYFRKNTVASYGVADTHNQIFQHGIKFVKANPAHDFVCLITPIYREDQSERGGWRYHKWGDYIGKRELKTEYLYDDPDPVDVVYVFSFVILR